MEPERSSERGQVSAAIPIVVMFVALVVVIGIAVVLIARSGGGGDDDDAAATSTTVTTGGRGEPQVSPEPTTTTMPATPVDVDLLVGGGFPAVYHDLLAAAGQPQVFEIDIYPDYAFLAYQDTGDPSHIDQRQWRDGQVGGAEANPGRDRVDETTQPGLFGPNEVDPTVIDHLVADAPLQYDIPVTVTHVIINRFLPFDQRVLIRVYAVPTDGRSGGGYVSYDTVGAVVNVCC